MKLTHKAIARAAGYRVTHEYRPVDYNNTAGNWKHFYRWYDVEFGIDLGSSWLESEEAAYKDCCIWNGLVEDEE